MNPMVENYSELIAAIESGIRSTGNTNIGDAARYQARAALRDLEEQLEAARRDASAFATDAELEARRADALQEQFDALRDAIRTADDRLQQPVDLNYVAVLKDDWEIILAKVSSPAKEH